MHELNFMERCYDAQLDEATWGAGLADTLAPLVPGTRAVKASSYEVTSDQGIRFVRIAGNARFMDAGYAAHTQRAIQLINTATERELILRVSYGSPAPSVAPMSAMPTSVRDAARAQLPWKSGDYLALFGTLDGKRGFAVSPGGPDLVLPSRRRHAQLVRLCEHLAAGYWLRCHRLERNGPGELDADAIFAPDGSVLHRSASLADPALRERLVDAVRGMDRARCRRRKHSAEEAAELWQGLVAGHYTLVEHFDRNGRRLILAIRCRSARPALSPREAAVARKAAEGLSNKEIADALGMAPSTVGVHLASALRKLQCPNRRLLSRWLLAHAGLDIPRGVN